MPPGGGVLPPVMAMSALHTKTHISMTQLSGTGNGAVEARLTRRILSFNRCAWQSCLLWVVSGYKSTYCMPPAVRIWPRAGTVLLS
jgi:hypothetical protein